MKNNVLHLALRELRHDFSSVKLWAAIIAVGFILGLSGPFDTLNLMPFGPRIVYWIIIATSTFATGAFVHAALFHILPRKRRWDWGFVLASGAATGVGVCILLLLLNWVALGLSPFSNYYVVGMFADTMVISLVVSALLSAIGDQKPHAKAQTETPLLSRLSPVKRGPVISLSVQDHYVNVTTTKGTSMVLMRLRDAISEVQNIPGLQVHRSHWVASSRIKSATRLGDKGVLTLSDGREIPVSRTYIKHLKQAGWFQG
ncbi:MAG: LytTR family DNA-binding domain-containing protein [Paracoccaceae bacterium]